MSAVLEKVVRVECHDSSLIRLRHVGEYHVDHAQEHAILVRVAGVLDDRYDVGALLGHVDEIATRAVREFDCIDETLLLSVTFCFVKSSPV